MATAADRALFNRIEERLDELDKGQRSMRQEIDLLHKQRGKPRQPIPIPQLPRSLRALGYR